MQYVWDRAVIINIVNIHIFPYIFSWRVTVYESFSIVWSRMDYFFMWMPQSRWILPNTLYFKLRYSPSNLLIRLADASSFFLAFIFQSINFFHETVTYIFKVIFSFNYSSKVHNMKNWFSSNKNSGYASWRHENAI